MPWKFITAMGILAIGVSATVEFYVHGGKGDFQDRASHSLDMLALHASGGIVGLDETLADPGIIPQLNPIDSTVKRIARKFGSQVEIADNQEFINIGPNNFYDNVYTFYRGYMNYGYAGMLLCTGIFGFICARIFMRSLAGGKIWILLYSVLAYNIVGSIFTEYFVAPLYFLSKVCLLGWCVYHLPVWWHKLWHSLPRSIERDLPAPLKQ